MKQLTLRNKSKKLHLSSLVVKLVLAWLIIAFLIYPNINLLISVFTGGDGFSTEVFTKILSSPRAMKSLFNSFILAITLIVTVNVVGTLIVFFTEYWEIKGAKLLKLGYMTSLIYGGVVLVTGYKFIYGSNGVITNMLTSVFPSLSQDWFVGYGAVVFIMTFACTSNHILFLTNAVRGLDYHTVEAAKNMGASAKTIFFKVVMPSLMPTFYAITILTFLTGLGAMAAPLIVGGEGFQTINPMIITFAKSAGSRDIAALLSIVLGVATIVLLTIFTKVEKRSNYLSVSKTKAKITKQKINNPVANIVAHIVAYVMFLIYVAPVVLILIFSFSDALAIKTGTLSLSSFTLANYTALFSESGAIRPYVISFVYAGLAAIIVAIIAIIVAKIVKGSKNKRDSFFEYGVLIPWLLPSTLIALGLMTTYDKPQLILGNKVLIGTLGILLIAYIITKMPFSYRMIKAAFYGVSDELEEAAKCMGASTFYTMIKVIIPVIIPAVLSVIVLNFNGLLTDYDLSVFLYHPLFKPLGIVIKAASDETATTNAQAMAFVYTVVLMIISSTALYLTQGNGVQRLKKRFSKRNRGKLNG